MNRISRWAGALGRKFRSDHRSDTSPDATRSFAASSAGIDKPTTTGGGANPFRAVLISTMLHCLLLIVLALIVFPEIKNMTSLVRLKAVSSDIDMGVDMMSLDANRSSIEDTLLQDEPDTFDADLIILDSLSQVDMTIDSNDLLVESDSTSPIQHETFGDIGDITDRKAASRRTSSANKRPKSAMELMSTVSMRGKSFDGPLLKQPKDGVRQTRTTGDAAEGILDHLRLATDHDGPMWILWLMDASISLVAERQQLAPLVKGFYEEVKVARKPGSWPWPTTAVFAFGQRVMPMGVNHGQPKPLEIANTIINLPIDESGTENVMSAVASAIATVPSRNPNMRIEVVVWTDESGDDLNALEDLILLCRQRNARVHVVGPLSVFGMRKGLQQFTLPPPYQTPILLPVDRGPDSAFPERAQLPYWYESTDIDWGGDAIIPADLGDTNFGGPHRQRLLAPSGPYALTRLALATGGTFTALNRLGDLAAASREQLFDYMPDYRSGLQISSDIDQYPLRRAVIEAAALTGTVDYWPPKMRYPTRLTDQFPYRSVSLYMPPPTFARRLPVELELSVRRLRRAQLMIEQAIEIMMLRFNASAYAYAEESQADLSFDEVSLDQVTPSEYHQEQSPRWKAWYDLNLGRLIAHSTRIREYILQCEIMASSQTRAMMVNRGFNQLTFTPSTVLQGGSVSATRTQTAVALLERVVRDHPDTPWGDLATWELQHAVGVEPVLSVVPQPPPVVGIPLPPQPRPTLPRL
jgi:hypothetical protein